ncbi:MAG: PilZ domain-containing protein [Pseudomonadota bacterium]
MLSEGAEAGEKRAFARLLKESKVEYNKLEYPLKNQKVWTGRIKNIGGGGLLFETDHMIDSGTVLRLDITLQGWHNYRPGFLKMNESYTSKPITAIAEVVRVEEVSKGEKYHIGVKFVNTYEDDLKGLLSFLEKSERLARES